MTYYSIDSVNIKTEIPEGARVFYSEFERLNVKVLPRHSFKGCEGKIDFILRDDKSNIKNLQMAITINDASLRNVVDCAIQVIRDEDLLTDILLSAEYYSSF